MKNKMTTTTLKTNRLILRKFTKNDITALFNIFGDEEINTYLPWFPIKSLTATKTFFIEKYVKVYQAATQYRYAICLKTDNIPIGYVNINGDDSYDLGYGLIKKYWKQGIMIEACHAIINLLKKDGIPYITATYDINNSSSGKVMKNLGMSYCYSFQEQCQPKNKLITFRMYQLNLNQKNNPIYKKYLDNAIINFIESDW